MKRNILLLLVFVFLSGVWPSESFVAKSANGDAEDVSLLFLLDESGGVNGLCKDTNVLEVDESRQLRYGVVNAFSAFLMMRNDTENGLSSQDLDLPLVRVGAAQFAGNENWQLTRPLQNDAKEIAKQLALKDQDFLQTISDRDWDSCKTNYESALQKGLETLQPFEGRKILILVTDGSFTGVEGDNAYYASRENLQPKVASKLEEIKDAGIEVWLVNLTPENTYEPDTCKLPLSAKACDDGRRDMDFWKARSHDLLLSYIQYSSDSTLFMDLYHNYRDKVENISFKNTTNFFFGEIENEILPISIPGEANELQLNMLFFEANSHSIKGKATSDDTPPFPTLEIQRLTAGEYWYAKEIPLDPKENICDSYSWNIISDGNLIAETGLFWWAHDKKPPIFQDKNFSENPIIFYGSQPSESRQFTLTVILDVKEGNGRSPCYALSLYRNDSETPFQTIPFSLTSSSHPEPNKFVFTDNINPADKAKEVRYKAELNLNGTSFDSISYSPLPIQYHPETLEQYITVECPDDYPDSSAGRRELRNIYIPVRYGGTLYDNNFAPPLHLEQIPGTTSTPSSRSDKQKLENALDIHLQNGGEAGDYQIYILSETEIDRFWDELHENVGIPKLDDFQSVIIYRLTLFEDPNGGTLGYYESGFRYLKIGPDGNQITRNISCPSKEDQPTPMLTSTPTSTPDPPPKDDSWKKVLVDAIKGVGGVILGGIGGALIMRKKRTNSSNN